MPLESVALIVAANFNANYVGFYLYGRFDLVCTLGCFIDFCLCFVSVIKAAAAALQVAKDLVILHCYNMLE